MDTRKRYRYQTIQEFIHVHITKCNTYTNRNIHTQFEIWNIFLRFCRNRFPDRWCCSFQWSHIRRASYPLTASPTPWFTQIFNRRGTTCITLFVFKFRKRYNFFCTFLNVVRKPLLDYLPLIFWNIEPPPFSTLSGQRVVFPLPSTNIVVRQMNRTSFLMMPPWVFFTHSVWCACLPGSPFYQYLTHCAENFSTRPLRSFWITGDHFYNVTPCGCAVLVCYIFFPWE